MDVEDTVYVVRPLRWAISADRADKYVQLVLSDGITENLDAETIRIGDNNIPYCKVINQHFEARFSMAAYYGLAEHAQYDPSSDAFFLSLNGRQYCLA